MSRSNGQQFLERIWQVIDASELRHHDRGDPSSNPRWHLPVRELGLTSDALAIVLDENVGQGASGNVAVGLASLASEDPACRKAVSVQDLSVRGKLGTSPT